MSSDDHHLEKADGQHYAVETVKLHFPKYIPSELSFLKKNPNTLTYSSRIFT